MLADNALDVAQLSTAKIVICGKRDVGIQPEFGAPALSVHVRMSGFMTIVRVKVEAIRTNS
jgi:hypothetical protein